METTLSLHKDMKQLQQNTGLVVTKVESGTTAYPFEKLAFIRVDLKRKSLIKTTAATTHVADLQSLSSILVLVHTGTILLYYKIESSDMN
jgi:hypothetical protein